jgi:UDP-N-acetylmuramoyl-L-alanyl-D-glutamate--2,6-diaminopimelate ligase
MATLNLSIRLSELLADVLQLPPESDRTVNDITVDSREVKQGSLFIACKGADKYIDQAVLQGAAVVLIDSESTYLATCSWEPGVPILPITDLAQQLGFIAARFYRHPSRHMQVIGVTGTNGKTSCTHFIAEALEAIQQKSTAVVGTLGNGSIAELQPSVHTTPQAVTLQKTLANFLAQGITTVAMEASSHGLDQGRVNGVDFAVGVFTNLTRDHLDYHGDMENYARAKRRLFEASRIQQAVINADDAFGQQLLKDLHPSLPVIAYTTGKIPSKLKGVPFLVAQHITLDRSGITADVRSSWGRGTLKSALLGRFNVSNLLAVLGTLLALEIPFEEALNALENLSGVPGRMEALGGGQQPLVVVDYAHTPDALEQALKALREHSHGQLWCVFGCGGDRDRGKRPLMGEIAERYADQLIITDDNPRTELPQNIVADIIQGLSPGCSVVVEHDRKRAIAHALACAKPGDVVLIAGKGHELYQLIGTHTVPFSDVLTAKLLLENRPNA